MKPLHRRSFPTDWFAIALVGSLVMSCPVASPAPAASVPDTSVTAHTRAMPPPVQRFTVYQHRLFIVDDDHTLWQTGELNASATTPILAKRVREHVHSVSAGTAAFFIDENGILWGWGASPNGELLRYLPPSWANPRDTPEKIIPLSKPVKILDNVRAVIANDSTVLAIRNDNSLWAWGKDDETRGDDLPRFPNRPRKILEHVVSAVHSEVHVLALQEDGSLWTWGGSLCGGMGQGEYTLRDRPVRIDPDRFGGQRVVDMTAYLGENSALTEDRTLWYWGGNTNARPYCVSNPVFLPMPLDVGNKRPVRIVFNGLSTFYVLTDRHTVYSAHTSDGPFYSDSTDHIDLDVEEDVVNDDVAELAAFPPYLIFRKRDRSICVAQFDEYNLEKCVPVQFEK